MQAFQTSLFDSSAYDPNPALTRCQIWTPLDCAEALWARFFGDLPSGSRVVEPTCGVGNLLQAIPDDMDVLGIEIDPLLAERARHVARPGWRVVAADFADVELPWDGCDAIFGNPPWVASVVDRLLDWTWNRLVPEGRCGLLLPANYTQYSGWGAKLAERWSIESCEIPRDMFAPAQLQECVSFKLLTKSMGVRKVIGMFLYPEVAARRMLPNRYQALLRDSPKTWREVVKVALAALNGRARLSDLYAEVVRKRGESEYPDKWRNNHWREKVRQVLQKYDEFVSVGRGEWALATV